MFLDFLLFILYEIVSERQANRGAEIKKRVDGR